MKYVETMTRNIPASDCAFLLERKLFQSASLEDVCYFLGTSDAKIPQIISMKFASKFQQLLDKALNAKSLQSVSVLTQVLSHIVQQDQSHSIQNLISSNLHSNFESMIDFYLTMICDKNCLNSGAVKPFQSLFFSIVDYCRRMNDRCSWLIQNILHVVLLILADPSAILSVKMLTSEKFLGIFEEEDGQASPCCRAFVQQNEQLFDDLSKRALGSLRLSGHLQLQELVVEIIIRMWMTDIRRRKAAKWFDNDQTIATKFLAISYDEFDYGVRMFLNQVNSSTPKRRILTLPYKELQIGKQVFVPTNEWCNCADLCYTSKILDVRYPFEEVGSEIENKCSWRLGSIKASDLEWFCIKDNSATHTIDLHMKFQEPASNVLSDFELQDQTATDLIIRFYRVMMLDAQRATSVTRALFGSKCMIKNASNCSVPRNSGTAGFGPWCVFGPKCDQDSGNASFVQLTQDSQRNSQTLDNVHDNASTKRHDRTSSQHVSIPAQTRNSVCDSSVKKHGRNSSQQVSIPQESRIKAFEKQTESQVLMMKNLAVQAAYDRENGNQVKKTSVPAFHNSQDISQRNKSSVKSNKLIKEQRPSQSITPTIHYPHVHRGMTSFSDEDGMNDHERPGHNATTAPSISSWISSIPTVPPRPTGTAKKKNVVKRRLSKDAKSIVHETDSDHIHGVSSDEFVDRKEKKTRLRKKAKQDEVVPETQVTLNTSSVKKPKTSGLNISAVSAADTSIDLMLQCLHGSGADQLPEVSEGDVSSENLIEKEALETRITRSQKKKQSPERTASGTSRSVTDHGHNKKSLDSDADIRRSESAASKVNDEFKKLLSQFKDKENIDNSEKGKVVERVSDCETRSSTGRSAKRKKRSLIDADAWQQLDEIVEVDQAVDPATKSVKKRPYAEKFIKNIATPGNNKDKEARRNRKTSTRKALRSLNIEPRQDKLANKPAEVPMELRKRNPPSSKKRKKDIPLPFENFEEEPNISDTQQHDALSPIETVRDATVNNNRPVGLADTEWILSPNKKTSTKLPSPSEVIDERKVSKKKKARVSFDPGAKTESQNEKKASERYFNKNRRKQARLFDSMSDANSGNSSEPSWILEHNASMKETPKTTKTYKGTRSRKTQQRKTGKKKQSLEEVINDSFGPSASFEETNVSPMTNNSVMSGVSLLQSLGSASNVNFEQIAALNDCLLSTPEIDVPAPSLCEMTELGLDGWNKLDLMPTTADDENVTLESSPVKLDKIGTSSLHDLSMSADCSSESETKEKEPLIDLTTAIANNKTPTPTQDRFTFTKKIFPARRKAVTSSSSSSESHPVQKKFLKSKKKLQMNRRSSNITEQTSYTSSSDVGTSSCDNSKAKSMMKLIKHYIHAIDQQWAEGHSQRAECIDSYGEKISKQVKHYESQMKDLENLQDEAVNFLSYFNSTYNTVMKSAAKGLLQSKLMCKDLTSRLLQNTQTQNNAMNELRRQISKDLKKQVSRVDKEDLQEK